MEKIKGVPTICICGDPGAGKTRLASRWEDAYILDIEGGGGSAFRDSYRTVYDIGPQLLAQVRDSVKKILELPYADHAYLKPSGKRVCAVVLDSLDALQQVYKVETLLKGGTFVFREPRQMWGKLLDDMMPLVYDTKKLKVPVIWIAHVKTVDPIFEGSMVKHYGWRGIATQGAIAEQIMRWFDYCFHIYVEANYTRKVFVQPTIYDNYRLHAAKDRHSIYAGRTSFVVDVDKDGFPKTTLLKEIEDAHEY